MIKTLGKIHLILSLLLGFIFILYFESGLCNVYLLLLGTEVLYGGTKVIQIIHIAVLAVIAISVFISMIKIFLGKEIYFIFPLLLLIGDVVFWVGIMIKNGVTLAWIFSLLFKIAGAVLYAAIIVQAIKEYRENKRFWAQKLASADKSED